MRRRLGCQKASSSCAATWAPLAHRPVRLFSVGTFGDTKRLIGPRMKREPKRIGGLLQALHPRYRVFAGVIDRHQVAIRLAALLLGTQHRLGDNRDWPEIAELVNRIGQGSSSVP